MCAVGRAEFLLPNEETARQFGAALGLALRPGMTVLLDGPVGAGKSHIARAAIRALAGEATEVPSPSFTLVQTYDTVQGEVWHADLYRLTGPDEVLELGLAEAMQSAIVLIEWPDRLGTLTPSNATRLSLQMNGDARSALMTDAPDALLSALSRWAA
jgi:tRNA threonylcarbamoyladenosine biosynthesis protein TsaE